MRIHGLVAIALLLVPEVASAQRIPLPRIGRRGPARPAPLPPQPAVISEALAYRRLRVSFETYPLVSHVETPGVASGGLGSWTSGGIGTRADYRVTRLVSATFDMTTTFLGGPVFAQTAELGTRLRPQRTERRVYPFMDIRAGYVYAFNQNFGTISDGYGYTGAPHALYAGRYSSGFGGVGGAGIEYALTRRFSLTTAASVMRSRMTAHDFRNARPTVDTYTMTSYRYVLGIRFNPVRMLRASESASAGR